MTKEAQGKTEKKFHANIEGKEYPREKETMTVAEMRTLGNLPRGLPVVEEFPDGTEKTLADHDTVVLKPGHRYGRAPKFKRGWSPRGLKPVVPLRLPPAACPQAGNPASAFFRKAG